MRILSRILGCALAFASMAPVPAAAPRKRIADLPSINQMPRPVPLWTAPFLYPFHRQPGQSALRQGMVLGMAWDRKASPPKGAVVGLDIPTGRERWRFPWPAHAAPPRLVFAGPLALLGDAEGWTTALEVATGERRWRSRLPGFAEDLEVPEGDRPDVAVGLYHPNLVPNDPGGAGNGWRNGYIAVAVRLETGEVLWRDTTGSEARVLAVAGREACLAGRDPSMGLSAARLRIRDLVHGDALRTLALPGPYPSAFQAIKEAPGLLLVTGQEDFSALGLSDGRVLWRRPMTGRDYGMPRPTAIGGRVLFPETRVDVDTQAQWATRRYLLRVLDPRSGAEGGAYGIPAGLGFGFRFDLQPGKRPGGLLLLLPSESEARILVRFERPGTPATLAALPADANDECFLGDGVVLHGHRQDGILAAYSAYDAIGSETQSLAPRQQVETILRRMGWRPEPLEAWDPVVEELRAVVGVESALADVAADPRSDLREEALQAAIVLRIPSLAALLLAEAARPIRGPMPEAAFREALERMDSRVDDAIRLRGYFLSSLAGLDDPAAAGALSSMLIDDRSPTGFGLADWMEWGPWPEEGYGRRGWPREGIRTHAFSLCLQAPSGRPAPHAAAYRMLARLGRASDLAVLARFDSLTAPRRGWADLCDEDDALRKPLDDAFGKGLCHGVDAGPFRFTQARAIWVRRRGPDGTLGPPAFAFVPADSGAYECPLRSALATGKGKFALSGTLRLEYEGEERPWRATLDTDTLFADRDGDGLTDRTERVIGTDPGRADSDADGEPDGTDPAPLAAPARDEAGRVADEALRYVTTFQLGGPISVYAAAGRRSGGGGASGAGIVLHRPLPDRSAPDCTAPPQFCADGRSGEQRARGGARCEYPVAIDSLGVMDGKAEVIVSWPEDYSLIERRSHRLELAKTGGRWRVVGDGDMGTGLTADLLLRKAAPQRGAGNPDKKGRR